MMEERILLILLGAGFGFLIKSLSDRSSQAKNKRKQEQNQKREDRIVLNKILETLSAFIKIVESEKSEESFSQHFDELYSQSFKIQHENNKVLADEIKYFVQEHRGSDPSFRKSLGEDINSLKSKLVEILRY
jgi:hypothetical protein